MFDSIPHGFILVDRECKIITYAIRKIGKLLHPLDWYGRVAFPSSLLFPARFYFFHLLSFDWDDDKNQLQVARVSTLFAFPSFSILYIPIAYGYSEWISQCVYQQMFAVICMPIKYTHIHNWIMKQYAALIGKKMCAASPYGLNSAASLKYSIVVSRAHKEGVSK